jgi:hypothetical protein
MPDRMRRNRGDRCGKAAVVFARSPEIKSATTCMKDSANIAHSICARYTNPDGVKVGHRLHRPRIAMASDSWDPDL